MLQDEEEEIKEEVKQPDEAEQESEAIGDTQTPSEVPELNSDPEPIGEEEDLEGNNESSEDAKEQDEKYLTQSQVNELVGRTRTEAREKALREFYERYGVNDDEELNGIFGKGQAYDVLNDDYASQSDQLRQTMAENALLKTGITEDRWDDAKAILSAKGLEINQDNIIAELQTHPEWKAMEETKATKQLTPEMADEIVKSTAGEPAESPSVIKKLGSESPEKLSDTSEEEKMNKLFGL